MKGAKGVIISIIGGEDMKLLEVDEAANHIRELVDPNANIIWGSAFNPDLQGKIRVSVVATGIEQTNEMAVEASRPYALPGTARGPAVPTSRAPQAFAAPEPEPAPATTSWSASPVTGLAHPTQSDEHTLPGAEGGFTGTPDPGDADSDETAALAGDAAVEDALDLELEIDEGRAEEDPVEDVKEPTGGYASLERLSSFGRRSSEDGLLGDADRLVEEDEDVAPKVSRGSLSSSSKPGGSGGSGGGSGGGATLFERMANLSRGGRQAGVEEEEAGDDAAESGGSLNIPRFLGRQNNQ